MTAFVSYSNKDRKVGAQAKAVLGEFGIDGFLAHEDLEISEEWKERILDELRRCDLFVPLLSTNFVKSEWARRRQDLLHRVLRWSSRHYLSMTLIPLASSRMFKAAELAKMA